MASHLNITRDTDIKVYFSDDTFPSSPTCLNTVPKTSSMLKKNSITVPESPSETSHQQNSSNNC